MSPYKATVDKEGSITLTERYVDMDEYKSHGGKMNAVFTMPGKMGDAMLQWPVVHQYIKQTGKNADLWLDEKACKPLVNLFKAQPGIGEVRLIGGIENHSCGGQPFHFNLKTSDYDGRTIYHLGFRKFPEHQITLQTLKDARVPISAPEDGWSPSMTVGDVQKANRLVLHGQSICPHSQTTPMFWKFLAGIKAELDAMFDEVYWVGTKDDLVVAEETYPGWGTKFDDGGDILETAKLMASARACIGAGSSMVVLSANLGVPTIRVHDVVGAGAPKIIWSNLGEQHINETELSLRKEWPIWRDKYLVESEVVKS